MSDTGAALALSDALRLDEAGEILLKSLLFHPLEKDPRPQPTTDGSAPGPKVPPPRRSDSVGLQSPLWFWTHRAGLSEAECATREAKNLVFLAEWLARCGTHPSQVSLLTFSPDVAKASKDLIERLDLLKGHSTVKVVPHLTSVPPVAGRIVLLSLGRPSSLANAQAFVAAESSLSLALVQPTKAAAGKPDVPRACVLIGDAAWEVNTHWPAMHSLIRKLHSESRRVSGTWNTEMKFSTLVHSRLPLCCSIHNTERELFAGTERATGCKRLCLKQYGCFQKNHLCLETCHPHLAASETGHQKCAYYCRQALPCGHKCLQKCHEPCDCWTPVEEPRSCSHEVITHLDDELQPVFATVPHAFKGTCANREAACEIPIPIYCARCSGKFEAPCHTVRNAGHGYAEESRVLVCETCIRREQKIRTECRASLIREADQKKKDLKMELRVELDAQRKAATRGVYRPGQRVVVVDRDAILEPLPGDYDGLEFETDGSTIPPNAPGSIYMAGQVDLLDMSSVQYVVKLSSGKHVLVQDAGLQLIGAALDGGSSTGMQPLMLTAGSTNHGDLSATAAAVAESKNQAPTTGKLMLLTRPIEALDETSGEHGVLENVIVEVLGEATGQGQQGAGEEDGDAAAPKLLRARCLVADFSRAAAEAARIVKERETAAAADAEATAAEVDPEANSDEIAAKRTRREDGNETPAPESGAPQPNGASSASLDDFFDIKTYTFEVPQTALEAIPSLGDHVLVRRPAMAISHPHEHRLLNTVLRKNATAQEEQQPTSGGGVYGGECFSGSSAASRIADHAMDLDEPCTVVGAMNWPQSPLPGHGPVFLLSLKRPAPQQHHEAFRRGGARFAPVARTRSAAESRFVAVPVVFTSYDDEAVAEAALDAAVLGKLEEIFTERLTMDTEERRYNNEEALFAEQQKLGKPGTPNALVVPKVVYFEPVKVPTAEARAERKALVESAAHSIDSKVLLAKKKERLLSNADPTKADTTFWTATKAMIDGENDALKMWNASVQKAIAAQAVKQQQQRAGMAGVGARPGQGGATTPPPVGGGNRTAPPPYSTRQAPPGIPFQPR